MSEAPKGLTVVSYVKFSQESANPCFIITKVDLRHEFLLLSEVPPTKMCLVSKQYFAPGLVLLIKYRNIVYIIIRRTVQTLTASCCWRPTFSDVDCIKQIIF